MSQTVDVKSSAPVPRELVTKPRLSDQIFRVVVTAGGMSSLIILGLIFAFLAYRGLGVLRVEGFGFITNSNWDVIEDENSNIISQDYGLAAMLVGTILSATVAVIVGVPIAVFSARFREFYYGGKI